MLSLKLLGKVGMSTLAAALVGVTLALVSPSQKSQQYVVSRTAPSPVATMARRFPYYARQMATWDALVWCSKSFFRCMSVKVDESRKFQLPKRGSRWRTFTAYEFDQHIAGYQAELVCSNFRVRMIPGKTQRKSRKRRFKRNGELIPDGKAFIASQISEPIPVPIPVPLPPIRIGRGVRPGAKVGDHC
jgi:hypothetical protein